MPPVASGEICICVEVKFTRPDPEVRAKMEHMLWQVDRDPAWRGILNNSIFTFFPSRTNMDLLDHVL
jgi:hypothetical protein